MSIHVICQACKSRFQVPDKFAGKQGPCPKCKAVITIPKLDEQVVIHAPDEFSGGATTVAKDAKGRSVLKPIPRAKIRVQPLIVGAAVGITFLLFGGAWFLGWAKVVNENDAAAWLILGIGAVLTAFPCVYAGYEVLRDRELEPYYGRALLARIAIVALVYAALWGAYGAVKLLIAGDPGSEDIIYSLRPLLAAIPLMLIGVFTCLATLDLEPIPAVFHFGFFLAVTVLLSMSMGLRLI